MKKTSIICLAYEMASRILYFAESCIYPSEISHCKSGLFGMVRKCICPYNPILSPLCLGLVILASFSVTESHCKGKRGAQLPQNQFCCATGSKVFLSLTEKIALIFQREQFFVLKINSRLKKEGKITTNNCMGLNISATEGQRV